MNISARWALWQPQVPPAGQNPGPIVSYLILLISYFILPCTGPSPQSQPSDLAGPGDLPQHEHDQLAEGLPQQLQHSNCGQNCI